MQVAEVHNGRSAERLHTERVTVAHQVRLLTLFSPVVNIHINAGIAKARRYWNSQAPRAFHLSSQ